MLQQIKQQIDRLRALGADYADARWVPVEENNYLLMWNGNLKEAVLQQESGIGVRVLYKGAWGFSAASDLGDLPGLFGKALDNAKAASQRVTFPVRLADKEAVQAQFASLEHHAHAAHARRRRVEDLESGKLRCRPHVAIRSRWARRKLSTDRRELAF